MKTWNTGDSVRFPEFDGIHIKQIEKILWSEKGKGDCYFPKDSILAPALEWCVILFDDGRWLNGKEFPHKANLFTNQ